MSCLRTWVDKCSSVSIDGQALKRGPSLSSASKRRGISSRAQRGQAASEGALSTLVYEHLGAARLVPDDEQLLVEVRDVQGARARERAGEQRTLAEHLRLDDVLAQPHAAHRQQVAEEPRVALLTEGRGLHIGGHARLPGVGRADRNGHALERDTERRGKFAEQLERCARRVAGRVHDEGELARGRIDEPLAEDPRDGQFPHAVEERA